jgi:hypothetical protein
MQPQRSQPRIGVVLQLFAIVLVLAGAFAYKDLADQYALATYHPRPDVAAIGSRLGLTDKARATLYRADPQIDDKTAFNKDCDTRPHELELGCYFRAHIYVLKIDNQPLAGEMDVVMAHELLHAAWVKMTASERQVLTSQLESAYASVATDDLKQRKAGYAKTEPGEEANELHSILGTEFANLPPTLEAHYAKYFTQRSSIVATHTAYQNVFDSRRAELEKELGEIRAEKAQLSVLNRQLETYRAAGQIQLYNSLVPRQNRMVDEINRRIAVYRSGVDEYNALSASLDSQQITDTEPTAQ